MDLEQELHTRLKTVREQIAAACDACGRRPDEVTLLAASKAQSAEKIRILQAAGLRDFGENYANELLSKAGELQGLDLTWHYIGHIQSNKIRRIVQVAATIQTVDNLRHARQIERHALELGKSPYPVWVAVNIAGEKGKNGCAPADLPDLIRGLNDLPGLQLRGLMAVPPRLDNPPTPEQLHHYKIIRKLAETCGAGQLSLGMSADLGVAIAHGSTMVRIGRALLGERPPKPPAP